jgi:hypothetical protein
MPATAAPARKAVPAKRIRDRKAAPARRAAPRRAAPARKGAAHLVPVAIGRTAVALRALPDSGLVVRLTRGRAWIGVLSVLLTGIVALNVISLSLTAGSGRLSLQIDELKTEISGLHAQIDERLSASKVEAEAARLGLANPDPKAITYLSASDGDAARLAHLLGTDSFLMAPSQPSSYPAPGTSYAPVSTSSTPAPTTTVAPTTTSAATAPSTSGTSSSSGSSSGSSGSTTGGVGL